MVFMGDSVKFAHLKIIDSRPTDELDSESPDLIQEVLTRTHLQKRERGRAREHRLEALG